MHYIYIYIIFLLSGFIDLSSKTCYMLCNVVYVLVDKNLFDKRITIYICIYMYVNEEVVKETNLKKGYLRYR